MKVKFKKLHPDAKIPAYAKPGDAAVDLTAISKSGYENLVTYGTGIAVEIPENHVGLLFPRSSVSKYDLNLTNCVGVIDSGYRGEIKFVFRFQTFGMKGLEMYNTGDRIGQLIIIPYPKIEFEEVDALSESERGAGGFGSSGQ